MATTHLFTLNGIPISFRPSAVWGTIGLWIALALLSAAIFDLTVVEVIIAGFLGMLIHWASEIFHQFGHAWAARRTGHPMQGIELYFIIGASVYPADEGDLPAEIHIRRALGGPIFSFALAIVGGILFALTESSGGLVAWITFYLFAVNLVVFSVAALIPLPQFILENDGATILEWWGKRGA
jgi:Zn-dependent protease